MKKTKNKNKIIYVKVSFTNCFFLKCNDGYMLIDTGYPNDYEKFVKKIKKINIELSEIKYIFLTHHHDDHSGFTTELVKNTSAKIIVHKNALHYLKEGKAEVESQPINRRIKIIFKIFNYFHEFMFPPVILSENDIVITGDNSELLKNLGIDGIILYTPGHTDDHLIIILSNGDTFAGDITMNFLNFTGIKRRPIYIQDIDAVYNSWQKMIVHGSKTIYPAHGKPFDVKNLIKYKKKFAKL